MMAVYGIWALLAVADQLSDSARFATALVHNTPPIPREAISTGRFGRRRAKHIECLLRLEEVFV